MTQNPTTETLLPSAQRRNVLFVAIDGATIGLMSAAASFVSVLVIRLGAPALWVSLLSSIPSTVALVMTIPWSQLAERMTRPQRTWAFSRLATHVIYPLVAIVPVILPGAAAARVIVVIWSLSALPSSLSNMMFTLTMGNAVPPDKRAFLMSRRWTAMGVATLIALPLVSQLIERLRFPLGYQIAFGINALIAALAFFCANQLQVPERTPPPRTERRPLRESVREQAHEVWQAKPFLTFIGGRALLNLGLALVAALIPIYWVKDLQVSDAWVGHFNVALSAATLVSYLPWTRIKRRYGARWVLVPSVVGTALYPALLSLARTPAAVLPAIVFNGLAASGLNLAFFDALFEVCPPGKQARFVAINMTVLHLMGVIGPPIGAALVNWMPIQGVMVIGTGIALAGGLVFAYSAFQTGIRTRLQASQQAVSKLAARARHPRPHPAATPLPEEESADRE
jgi:Na+/melibiose symporter-like transporter